MVIKGDKKKDKRTIGNVKQMFVDYTSIINYRLSKKEWFI